MRVVFFLHLFVSGASYDKNPEIFYNLTLVATAPRITDKFIAQHAYHELYGEILFPRVLARHQNSIPIRFFEIGLGVTAGQQKSFKRGMHVWRELLSSPNDRIFIAEFNRDAALELKSMNVIPAGIQIVIGDQGNSTDVRRWVQETGGDFDFVVDDGGHMNHQILTSFYILWETLKPGGIYFIEDLQVLRRRSSDIGPKVPDVIKDWIEQLMLPTHKTKESETLWQHPLPVGVKWIICQYHLCAIAKCKVNDVARCSGP
jgi:hypothetical protein